MISYLRRLHTCTPVTHPGLPLKCQLSDKIFDEVLGIRTSEGLIEKRQSSDWLFADNRISHSTYTHEHPYIYYLKSIR